MSAETARRDLAEKVKLERKLSAQLRAFNKRIVNATAKDFADNGLAFDAGKFEADLEAILLKHYGEVAGEFDGEIAKKLPKDQKPTTAELTAIAASLAAFFAARAKEQARLVTETNKKDVETAVSHALDVGQEEANKGRQVSRGELGLLAGAFASRSLSGRVTGIAVLETQAAAETAKATEAQILAGQAPSTTGGSPMTASVTKEWVTVGDERVRDDHVAADAQVVDLNTPFTVGGQLLNFPGDTSLGASIDNVINCRCSSVVNTEDVLAIRVRKGEEEQVVDRTASEQLLTSIGE